MAVEIILPVIGEGLLVRMIPAEIIRTVDHPVLISIELESDEILPAITLPMVHKQESIKELPTTQEIILTQNEDEKELKETADLLRIILQELPILHAEEIVQAIEPEDQNTVIQIIHEPRGRHTILPGKNLYPDRHIVLRLLHQAADLKVVPVVDQVVRAVMAVEEDSLKLNIDGVSKFL